MPGSPLTTQGDEEDSSTGFFGSAFQSPSSFVELALASAGALALGCVFSLLQGNAAPPATKVRRPAPTDCMQVGGWLGPPAPDS